MRSALRLFADPLCEQKWGEVMIELTKQWVDELVDYRDSKNMNNSVLMLPKSINVHTGVIEYAKTRGLDIRFETREPSQFVMSACYLNVAE
jgi:hypothetical protein